MRISLSLARVLAFLSIYYDHWLPENKFILLLSVHISAQNIAQSSVANLVNIWFQKLSK